MKQHFLNKEKSMPSKLEDMATAHGEWVIDPYWCAKRESFEPSRPETPSVEDEYGQTEKPQFFLEMLRHGYQIPWQYQRFGQIALELYVSDGKPDPVLNNWLSFNRVLDWWASWQIKDWYQRPEEEPVVMPPNTRTLSTQTEVQLSDMTTLDHRNSYLDEVLDFYVKRSGSAFEEDLMIAFNNVDGYCRECSHC